MPPEATPGTAPLPPGAEDTPFGIADRDDLQDSDFTNPEPTPAAEPKTAAPGPQDEPAPDDGIDWRERALRSESQVDQLLTRPTAAAPAPVQRVDPLAVVGEMPDPNEKPEEFAAWQGRQALALREDTRIQIADARAEVTVGLRAQQILDEFNRENPQYSKREKILRMEFNDATRGLGALPDDATELKRRVKLSMDSYGFSDEENPDTPRTRGASRGSRGRRRVAKAAPATDDDKKPSTMRDAFGDVQMKSGFW